jgi:hypothetical protein
LYVDDLIHSCSSTEEALQIIIAIEKMLNTSSFKIKEWSCSSSELRAELSARKTPSNPDTPSDVLPEPKEDPISQATALKPDERTPDVNKVSLDREDGVKTLGVSWNPRSDTINFEVKSNITELYTKRIILSNISRLFDPLGLASAVTIKARIELQDIWKTKKFDWDNPLPQHDLFPKLRLYLNCKKPLKLSYCLIF